MMFFGPETLQQVGIQIAVAQLLGIRGTVSGLSRFGGTNANLHALPLC